MKRIMFLAISVMLIMGCISEENSGAKETDDEDASFPSKITISADKEVYHSSDVVKLSVNIFSSAKQDNVAVRASGIGGRFRDEKIVNLSDGVYGMSFSYKLPGCNSCGGIRAGMYNFSCEAASGNRTIKDSVSVDIRQ